MLEVRLLLETGEIEQASQRLQTLAPLHDLDAPPYLSGRHLLLAAGIHAALGQPEAALDTLRPALAAGLPFGVELHALPILQPLAHIGEFQRLLRPRN